MSIFHLYSQGLKPSCFVVAGPAILGPFLLQCRLELVLELELVWEQLLREVELVWELLLLELVWERLLLDVDTKNYDYYFPLLE